MHNFQVTSGGNDCNKHVSKYIDKIDRIKYVIFFSHEHNNEKLVSKSTFLYKSIQG